MMMMLMPVVVPVLVLVLVPVLVLVLVLMRMLPKAQHSTPRWRRTWRKQCVWSDFERKGWQRLRRGLQAGLHLSP